MSSTKLGKKILSVTLATTTTIWLSGLTIAIPFAASAAPGGLVDGNIFHASGDTKVYVAKVINGKNFKRWIATPEIFNSYRHLSWANLKTLSASDANMYAESRLIWVAGGDGKVWYVEGLGISGPVKRYVASPDVMAVNHWDWDSIYTVNSAEAGLYVDGGAIVGVYNPTPVSPTPSSTGSTGSTLQVGNPDAQIAATTMVSDSTTGGGGESLRAVMKIKLTAGSTSVMVKKLVLKRSGISADADISDMYLYDGMTRVAETPSVSSAMFTFSNTAGMFTVPANSSKEITVKVDLATNTAGGKTIMFSLGAMADVETDGAPVAGTFPINSNTHSTANVSDLGRMYFQNSYPTSATTIDPQTDLDIWRFTAQASDQDIEIRRMRVTIVGTIVAADLTNLKLLDGGVQFGSTVANLTTDKVADFDLTAKPLVIKAGQTRTITLRADVVGGTNRTFRPSVQKRSDVEVYDTGYNVWIRPMTASASDTFSIMQPNSSADFSGTNRDMTISSGTLTVTVATDSPSATVPNAGTNVILARYDVKAAGEDIKITDLVVCLDRDALVATTDGLANGKVYVNSAMGKDDYVQVGSTDSLLAADSTTTANCDDTADFNAFTLGSQFIVKAGVTRQLEVRADVSNSGGTATASGDTYIVSLNAGNSSSAANAQGLTSLVSLTVPAADLAARTVTNSAAALTVAVNGGLSNYTANNPLVVGASASKIASIAITAGAGESVDLNSIQLQSNGTDTQEWGDNFTNLKICKKDTNCSTGNQIGATATSLSTTDEAEVKTFSVSPTIRIAAGTQYIVDVHADVLSSATNTNTAIVGVRVAASGVSGTGVTTGTSLTAPTAVTNMQTVYISGGGTLSITAASSSDLPVAQIYNMTPGGSTANEVVVGKFRLNPQFENFQITRMILNDTFNAGMGSTTPTSTLRNIRMYVGSVSSANLIAGPVSPVSTQTPVLGSYVDFNGGFTAPTGDTTITIQGGGSSIVIPADTIKTVIVTAETNNYLQASSGQTHVFSLQSAPELAATAIRSTGLVTSTAGNGPSSTINIGNTYEMRRSYPIVVPDTTGLVSGNKLSNGSTQSIYRFKISAPSNGSEVRVKKMTFQVVLTDTTTTSGILALANWTLKRNGSPVTASDYRFFNNRMATTSVFASLGGTGAIANCLAAAACDDNETDGLRAYAAHVAAAAGNNKTETSSTTQVALIFTTEESVSAGSTNTYELVADVQNVSGASGDSDSVAVSILGDSTALAGVRTGNVVVTNGQPAGAFGVSVAGAAATAANFVWSDLWQGITAHGTPTATAGDGIVTVGTDWTNGTLVAETVSSGLVTDFLPTGQFLLSK